ncbi:TPA: hypothetical protein H7E43_002420 [Escherichia coli]|uniref:helix-turn-helix transcriptional regulator n=2 Tax=Escherichia coli TaxID=562 RepID=UPI00177131EA|nr:helix-turn-helix domain-containing protein [Escherichia coli]EGK9458238.1 hypothetical protein [Escherichia coli]EHI0493716.1 hypothetical protein [Escherichia coli]EHI0591032.1 hypothetical protein [Escherichia coli]EIY9317182.1 hypothetical protein [Escherichia coli]EJA8030162.1 hypothetical protein [Escherichia coli]
MEPFEPVFPLSSYDEEAALEVINHNIQMAEPGHYEITAAHLWAYCCDLWESPAEIMLPDPDTGEYPAYELREWFYCILPHRRPKENSSEFSELIERYHQLPDEGYVGVKTIATLMGYSERHFRRLLSEGKIPPPTKEHKKGHRLQYTKKHVRRILEEWKKGKSGRG